MSVILRHKLVEYSLRPDAEGYVKLGNFLKLIHGLTEKKVREIVETSDKQRFGLKELNGETYIRANQGHSGETAKLVSENGTRLTTHIKGIIHGTYSKFLPSILKDGLKRGGRKHIHFAKNLEAISGIRTTNDIIIVIRMKKAMEDGIVFFESANGVILSEGNEGILKPHYFKEVKYIKTGEIIWTNPDFC